MSTRARRAHRRRMLSHVGENARECFLALGMRILTAETGEPVGSDRMFEKDGPRPDLSDEALRDLKPGDQSPLPWPQSPGQHWSAHSRAEIDQRNDVVQIVAVIVFVRPGDQQMLAGDARRALKPFEMEPALARPVRQRPVGDRLDRRQVPLPKRTQEGVAPNSTLWRNEETECRKPILIDEMLKRHRRRMDGVVEIVNVLRARRIYAERMHPGPVLGGSHDLALRERWRKASLVRDDCQICRIVESDWRAFAGHRQRVAQAAPQVSPGRADGVPPGCVQRSVKPNERFVFNSVARHAAPLAVQQVWGPAPRAQATAACFGAGLCPNALAATRAPYPPRLGPPA